MLAASIALLAAATAARPLEDAPPLTIEELRSSTTTPSSTISKFEIPPNPEARIPPPKVKPIPLPVFDPATKFEYPPNPNRARWIDMPPAAFSITFDKNHPAPHFDLTKPIQLNLGKQFNSTYICAFCLKIVFGVQDEIKQKGISNFTEEMIKACEQQKDVGQAGFSCDHIEKDTIESAGSKTASDFCISRELCANEADVKKSLEFAEREDVANKEQLKLQQKQIAKMENNRRIIEAQEEAWRKEFKRAHNDSAIMPRLLVNMPEGYEGSGEEDWTPNFGSEDANATSSGSGTNENKPTSEFATEQQDEVIEQSMKQSESIEQRQEEAAVKEHFKVALEDARNSEKEELGELC